MEAQAESGAVRMTKPIAERQLWARQRIHMSQPQLPMETEDVGNGQLLRTAWMCSQFLDPQVQPTGSPKKTL
jgi:hypothetical protein